MRDLRVVRCMVGLVMGVMVVSGGVHVGAQPLVDRVAASRHIAVDFMATLKGALMEAIQAGGPAHAVSVCREKAPEIAHSYSKGTGWNVARTSLKTRNKANAPDDWERVVLLSFERRSARGEDISAMEHWEVTERHGRKVFRYMKVIPTGGLCLTCHGGEVASAIDEILRELYPKDQAKGFRVGDIRGAFTIVQPVE